MGVSRTLILLMLAAGQAGAQTAAPGVAVTRSAPSPFVASPLAAAAPNPTGNRIFLLPPMQWDNAMLSYRPAWQQTAADLANLTGGISFGMPATEVNATLPEPYAGMSWSALSLANEYPDEVRSFGVPIGSAGTLRLDGSVCPGSSSYVVFLFRARGLFRISYRFVADTACENTDAAARAVFAHYVTLGQAVALSVRYRTGKTDVVDVTDPMAGFLIPVRWRQDAS